MVDRCAGANAELLEDEAYRFVVKAERPVYTYPSNGLPTVKKAPKAMETSFLVAARRAR